MYKIYINEKPVFICTKEEFPNIENLGYPTINEIDRTIFNITFLEKLENKLGLVLISNNSEETFKQFSESLKIIEAAGGLIFNTERTKILFIYRRNKWDLPKGKIDEGESIKKAAWREVAEECGLTTHKIEVHLIDTYHIYFFKEKWVLKKTYWYIMSAEEEKLVPQVEEDITMAEWIPIDKTLKVISEGTYPTILDILEEVGISD